MTDGELIAKYAPNTSHTVVVWASWERVNFVSDVIQLLVGGVHYVDTDNGRERVYTFENGAYRLPILESEIKAAEVAGRVIVYNLGRVSKKG